jgi:translocation and assembly module TamB
MKLLPKSKTLWRWAGRLLVAGAIVSLVLVLLIQAGVMDRWARAALIRRIEKATGGRVELRSFHFVFLALRAEMQDFTLHGREPEGTPPFFHADTLSVDIRVDSLLRRRISLDEVRMVKPAVHVRMEKDGSSNVPAPPATAAPGKPFRERFFDLVARRVFLEDGQLLFNQTRVPLVAQGADFQLALEYHQAVGEPPYYSGHLRWRQLQFVVQRYLPTATELAAKFTLTRDSFHLQKLSGKVGSSTITVEARRPAFIEPLWHIRYQGELVFADLRHFLRMPNFPDGRARIEGAGEWKEGSLALQGRYTAAEIDLPYQWFHARGLQSSGSYRATSKSLEVPDFAARVLGGTVRGRVHLEFSGMQYRTDLRLQGMSVAALLSALQHPGFPVESLRWDGVMDAEAVTSWHHDFQSLDSRGVAAWSPPLDFAPGHIPVTARFDYYFSRERASADLRKSFIATPHSRIEFSGKLAARDSALLAKLDARDLLEWNAFIHALRGPHATPTRIAGHAAFDGSLFGPLGAPVFHGAVKIRQAEYGPLAWDQIEGELVYSPREFRFDRGTARRGRSAASLDLWLELEQWSFRPESGWALSAELVRAPTDDLQSLFGTSYPARGLLTGQFRARGTRALPEFNGLLDFTEVETAGLKLDRARGHLQITRNGLTISNAEVRKSTGRLTGNLRYRFADSGMAFDAAGAVIPLAQLDWLASTRFPVRGTLSFQVRGEGPLAAPRAEGSARLVDFGIGEDTFGSFEARLRSDGRLLQAELSSAMAEGSALGNVELQLAGDYPLRGEARIEQIDLDAFFQTALRLPHESFTGHSRVDGTLKFAGPLAHPRTIAVDADFTRLTLGYEQVRLENDGPIQLTYRGEEVRIARAHLKGPDTDLQVRGFARFLRDTSGEQRLGLDLRGRINLQLLSSFVPGLEARGGARLQMAIEGSPRSPRVTGRMSAEDASAVYGDFPASLSHVRGDLVFDASRMSFDGVTAEAGGGKLALSGSVSYGDGPLHYDLGINASRVRIRYPQGMSWLLGGGLRLAGTARGALLSGRVFIERLLLSEGFDFAALLVKNDGLRAPGVTSPFLRNLQFDIEAVSAPGARMEWATARVECEAQFRVRGTWERPILLGHIHLLSGEMSFRGNRYTITRGDINFANPRQIDPLLNIEATTTIRQYEVTLNFAGPASRLTLAYRSDPPLPSSDIIALLALGRTGEESELRRAGTGQTAAEGAGQILSEAISSQIGGRIERLFGVSRFRIDPFLAGTGTEQNASARITIEQQVARDLVITYITNVSSAQYQVIQIEYAVSRDVSIIALRDQNGTFGFDVKFKKRFK